MRNEKRTVDYRQQIAARDIRETIGIFGSRNFEFCASRTLLLTEKGIEDCGEQIAARDTRKNIEDIWIPA